MLTYHIIAFNIGIILDLIIGDPYWMPHPIRAIGSLISWLDRWLLRSAADQARSTDKTAEKSEDVRKGKIADKKEFRLGIIMVLVVTTVTLLVTGIVILGAYYINAYIGIGVEAILTCYVLAAKSLRVESMKVYEALKTGDIEKARVAVSMIVGRDTDRLDSVQVAKAAVETVAENTSDGVIAPLLYSCIGGPILGMLYKSINTMDSMIGYRNDRYEYFGKCAARLDDVANFLPARLSAFFMLAGVFFSGKRYDFQGALRIFRRDRFNSKSPNSAQTESVCAGALCVRLLGDAYYFGKLVKKPFIGDELREINMNDIRESNRLMYMTELVGVIVCNIALVLLWLLM